MTPQEQLEILQAYNEGKEIELKYILEDDSGWITLRDKNYSRFNFMTFDYRIKPQEIKYRPYTPEELKDAWLMHKGLVRYKLIQTNFACITKFFCETLYVGDREMFYEELLEMYVWADDGSACGVLITEDQNKVE